MDALLVFLLPFFCMMWIISIRLNICFSRDSVAFTRDETVPACTWNRKRSSSYARKKYSSSLAYEFYVIRAQESNRTYRSNVRGNGITFIYLIYTCIFFCIFFFYLSYLTCQYNLIIIVLHLIKRNVSSGKSTFTYELQFNTRSTERLYFSIFEINVNIFT